MYIIIRSVEKVSTGKKSRDINHLHYCFQYYLLLRFFCDIDMSVFSTEEAKRIFNTVRGSLKAIHFRTQESLR